MISIKMLEHHALELWCAHLIAQKMHYLSAYVNITVYKNIMKR